MQDVWLNARPQCTFESAHLSIRYHQSTDDAEGFILDRTQAGAARKYLYEASFRNGSWAIRLTAADPGNRNSFWDRDGPAKSLRKLSGMARGARKDLVSEIALKLDRFRARILTAEDELRRLAAQGEPIETPADRARYVLSGTLLIRIQRTAVREFVHAVEAPDGAIETAVGLIR